MIKFAIAFISAACAFALSACSSLSEPGTVTPVEPRNASTVGVSAEDLAITKSSLLVAETIMTIRTTYKAANPVEKYEICDKFTLVADQLTAKDTVDIVNALTSQQAGAADAFQDQRWDCVNLGDSNQQVIAIGEGDSGDWRPAGEYSPDELFSPAVVDILNNFDLGNDDKKREICEGVSGTADKLSSRQIRARTDQMTDYDRSVLQDLISECMRTLS